MRDTHSVPLLEALHPKVKNDFRKFIEDCELHLNITIRIVQGLRTFKEQAAIYAQGRTTPGKIVTFSPAGSSYHNYGLAIDVVPMITGVADWNYHYTNMLPYANPFGISWGGLFPHLKDNDHFEKRPGGINWRTLLHLHDTGKLLPGTDLVDF